MWRFPVYLGVNPSSVQGRLDMISSNKPADSLITYFKMIHPFPLSKWIPLKRDGGVTMPFVYDESKRANPRFVLTFPSACLIHSLLSKIQLEVKRGTFFDAETQLRLIHCRQPRHAALHISKGSLCRLCHNLSVLEKNFRWFTFSLFWLLKSNDR